MEEKVLIIDFGSQYTQLIARRLRELNVYSEIHPCTHLPEHDEAVKAVILSGSPYSVTDGILPAIDLSVWRGKLPLLGVCYGAQYLAHSNNGKVTPSKIREYGRATISHLTDDVLFSGISLQSQVWMSHGDTITELPEGFHVIASTHDVHVAAFKIENEPTYGIQFHPEVTHSTDGKQLLFNFIKHVAGLSQSWTPVHFIENTTAELKQKLGNDKVILGLSGGVDSSVAALLLHHAIGKNLTGIFIDNGLLRKHEFEQVLEAYNEMGLNVVGVNAAQRFLHELNGISDPEQKRKTIGRVFIEVFEEEAAKIDGATWLAQGTIYPDVIESVSVKGPSATIKSHHNVGGLPEKMKLKIVEPLRMLFKDEVRAVGGALGLNPNILNRHPFPGPGLAIRVLGEITEEKLNVLKEADAIFIDELKAQGLYDKVWQAGAIFLPVQSVGVMGDERTYQHVVCLRAVTSVDGMTADWSHLPYEFMATVSNKIINRVKGINRVVYDISSKPPATIEWE
ncbi:MAG: glutamine-hydrolyzing GMP synthase [Bacteroidia bacterium]|jgi:GMP synthase (glutamine-hydrolysing)|nr:glutamine-hydrolyzing GMP synthase [Bacteroidia bacterium]